MWVVAYVSESWDEVPYEYWVTKETYEEAVTFYKTVLAHGKTVTVALCPVVNSSDHEVPKKALRAVLVAKMWKAFYALRRRYIKWRNRNLKPWEPKL